MLQIQHIPNLITRPQHHVHIRLRMRRAHAEPHPPRRQRCRRVRNDDDDNGQSPRAHQPVEHVHLPRVEQQQRYNRRRGVAVRDEPELLQAGVQVPRIKRQSPETLRALGARC